MKKYKIIFYEKWDKYFKKLDNSVQKRLSKKILALQDEKSTKHLKHGLPYFVIESGQYRICFKKDEERKRIKLYFAGTHKDYEKWVKEE